MEERRNESFAATMANRFGRIESYQAASIEKVKSRVYSRIPLESVPREWTLRLRMTEGRSQTWLSPLVRNIIERKLEQFY